MRWRARTVLALVALVASVLPLTGCRLRETRDGPDLMTRAERVRAIATLMLQDLGSTSDEGAVWAGGWESCEELTGPAVTYRVGADFTLDDLREGVFATMAADARGHGWRARREPHAITITSGDVEGELSVGMRYLSVDFEVTSGCYPVSRSVSDRLTLSGVDEGR